MTTDSHAGMWTVALAVLVLLVGGGCTGSRDGGPRGDASEPDQVSYVCPTHPGILVAVPGTCSICGHPLEPARAKAPIQASRTGPPPAGKGGFSRHRH